MARHCSDMSVAVMMTLNTSIVTTAATLRHATLTPQAHTRRKASRCWLPLLPVTPPAIATRHVEGQATWFTPRYTERRHMPWHDHIARCDYVTPAIAITLLPPRHIAVVGSPRHHTTPSYHIIPTLHRRIGGGRHVAIVILPVNTEYSGVAIVAAIRHTRYIAGERYQR